MKEPPTEPRPPLKERLKRLLEEWGKIAVITYFTIFAAVFAGFAIAIHLGVHVESNAGTAGTIGAAYVATKLTQPLRILVTLLLTPIIGKGIERVRGKKPPSIGPG